MTRHLYRGSRVERQELFLKGLDEGLTVKESGARVGLIGKWAYDYYADIKARNYAPPSERNAILPPPDDFAEMAPTMTKGDLARHYAKHHKAVGRWLREMGLVAKPYVPPVKKPKPEPTRAGPLVNRASAGAARTGGTPQRDITQAGEAAHFLRRTIIPVYRADMVLSETQRRKLPDRGRDMFVVGHYGVIPAAEVIAMAEKRGYRAAGL